MNVKLEDIKIRSSYKPGDVGYITYMHGSFYDYGKYFETYVAETLAAFYNTFDERNEKVWVAEHNDQIVGTIALKNTNSMAQLRYFLLHPDYRGIGLGKRLMDLFMKFMKDCGYQSSFLTTEDNLIAAAHLYKKYGYEYVSYSVTEFGLKENRYELHLDN